jgi:exonuclease SbcC
MILRSIVLNNIRSYKESPPIDFSIGTSLFEGDVGCGKSTILSAIEFALFGLGDQDGRYLLRNGEKNGSVLLAFEVNGKGYQTFRSLVRRGKSVSQKEGYVVEDGVRTDYSVGEMKAKILEVLNFKERIQPKTSSVIYRYAVFTPQEMMKEVLAQSSDKRLETLRRAFGIEEYSAATSNGSVLSRWFDGQTKTNEGIAKDLEEKQEARKKKVEELNEAKNAAHEAKTSLDTTVGALDQKRKRLDELEPLKNRLVSLKAEIPAVKENIENAKADKSEHTAAINRLKQELAGIKEAKAALMELKPSYDEYNRAKTRMRTLRKQVNQYDNLENLKTRMNNTIDTTRQHLFKSIEEMKDEIGDDLDSIRQREPTVGGTDSLRKKERGLKAEVRPLRRMKSRLSRIDQNLSGIRTKIGTENDKLKEKQSEWGQIASIGYGAPCPRCKQKLTREHYERVKSQYEGELSDIRAKIGDLRNQQSELKREHERLKKETNQLESKSRELTSLSNRLAGLKEKKASLDRDKKAIKKKTARRDSLTNQLNKELFCPKERAKLGIAERSLKALKQSKDESEKLSDRIEDLEKQRIVERYKDKETIVKTRKNVASNLRATKTKLKQTTLRINSLKRDLRVKSDDVEENKNVLGEIEETEAERNKLEEERTTFNGKYETKKHAAEMIETDINDLDKEIELKLSARRKRDLYGQSRVWLEEHFIPCIEDIERHVLVGIKEEFNGLFERWFGEMIETGDINVRVGDDFTPIIEQGGYELDVESLSSGERTSVALAYRLALNVMVKKVCNAMQSNLLILDEPTDGFSKEQLARLRDVLRELNSEQVVVVSHEKELESFVDRVYRVVKENGVSRVQSVIA